MNDSTIVYFTGISKGFTVSPVLAQFQLPFLETAITIRWYGAIIAFGFLLAVLWGGRVAYKWKMNLDKMIDVLIYGTFGGIIGARLYYVAFEWEYYSQHLTDIFKIWNGGLAIYGGIIGGLLAAYITCHFNKLNFRNLLDCAAMSLLIGQGIGRWGNFANQEAFGTNTSMPWGMISEKTTEYLSDNMAKFKELGISVDPALPVHPTFLYEFLWCMASFVIIFIVYKKFRKFSGQLFLTYGVLYGTGRAIIEGFRTDSLYIGSSGIRVSQLLSAIAVVVCLALMIYMLQKIKKHPQPIEGVDFFAEAAPADKTKESKQITGKELRELREKRAMNEIKAKEEQPADAVPEAAEIIENEEKAEEKAEEKE